MKIEGKEVVQVHDPEEPKIINLMEALKRSVAEAQAAGGQADGAEKNKAKAGLQQAPSAKPARTAAKKKKVG
jgi:non-homologous end joining protein Ku